jgi:hypothetical protein
MITALRATYFSGSKFSCGHGSDGPKLANELQLWGTLPHSCNSLASLGPSEPWPQLNLLPLK